MRSGDGLFAWPTGAPVGTETCVLDLATGREQVIALPAGASECEVVYVSRADLLLACGSDPTMHRSTLYRVDPRLVATDL